jgi:hypothetical protein
MRRTLAGLLALGISTTGLLVVATPTPALADAPVAGNVTFSVPPTVKSLEGPAALTTNTSGGTNPYTVSIVSPPSHAATNGFMLNGDNSFIYQPVAGFVGTDSFTFQVTDALTATSNVATAYIDVGFFFQTTALPSATRNVPYSFTMSVPGGTTPYHWAKLVGSSPLPRGLRFYGKTKITLAGVIPAGTIAGTPNIHILPGTIYTYTFRVQDNSRPRMTVFSQVLTLTVN